MGKRRLSSGWGKPLSAALRAVSRLQRTQSRAAAAALRRAMRASTAAASKVGKTPKARKPVKSGTASHPSVPRGTGTGTGSWSDGLALGPGGARRYRLFMPTGVPASARLPLVVMLHGCSQSAETFALSTRINRLAVQAGFGVLYPEQDRHANLQGCWNWYDTDSRRAYREAATLLAAVDQVVRLHPLDATRVAVAGLSAGASMAALLASQHPARFAAVVMHSGVPPGAAHSTATALRAMLGRAHAPAAAVPNAASAPAPTSTAALASASLLASTRAWPPLLVIHGTADRVVAASNGAAAAQAWANAAGARASPSRVVQRGKRRAMTVTDFKRRGQTVATLCLVDGLGHAWSGGAASQRFSDATGPDASRMVWAFATRQFERSGPA